MSSKSSSLAKLHPYVKNEILRMRMYRQKSEWHTAKIIRKTYPNNKNKPDEIVKIVRVKKEEE